MTPQSPDATSSAASDGLEVRHQFLVQTPRGTTKCVNLTRSFLEQASYAEFVAELLLRSEAYSFHCRSHIHDESCTKTNATASDIRRNGNKRCLEGGYTVISQEMGQFETYDDGDDCIHFSKKRRLLSNMENNHIQVVHQGKIVNRSSYRPDLWTKPEAKLPSACCATLASRFPSCCVGRNDVGLHGSLFQHQQHHVSIRIPVVGGVDRQNRVGSKFGGGGVSSSQNAERERKERLKQLALESIDLAKDPYLMRNHLGTYECKLCLTLHTNEANYLAHTQGKKHQQGLARRAHMEKLRQERERQQQGITGSTLLQQQQQQQAKQAALQRKVRIGRPAYQVFKSRDPDTNQRCLSFEISFPEMDTEDGSIQPRHRFMSAFEQRVDMPPDRRYQYLLFAAEPYETIAFKIPNDPIDKGEGRFFTHWNADEKKFTLTLHFVDEKPQDKKVEPAVPAAAAAATATA